MDLATLGWNPYFRQHFEPHRKLGLLPGRVAREDRGIYLVLTAQGELNCEVAGKMRHEALARADFPAVGDWVALQARFAEGRGTIQALLPRRSRIARQVANGDHPDLTEEQIIAANVDTVFLVSGLDDNLNVRRIERYLTQAWESGANPVIVLNKADLTPRLEAQIEAVEAVAMGVPLHAISARTGQGLEALAPYLAPGQTVVLVGSSGVGKSTLINSLLGEERLRTSAVREDDSRGRHTTTHRELVSLPGGALIIDNPGMRELQLWGNEEDLSETFDDITALAARCRFRDCRHEREPGCAVRRALQEGTLDPGRIKSYQKMLRELAFLATRTDQKTYLLEHKARAKQRARVSRNLAKAGGKHG